MVIQRIRQLPPQELDQVVNLHKTTLRESFLNNFGKIFLKISYKTIIKSQNNITLVAYKKHKLIGFLVATLDGDRFNKEVIQKNFFPLSLQIIKASIKNPILLFKIIKWKFRTPHQNKIKPELQFIAINLKYQNKGLGTKLIKELEKEFKKTGVKEFRVGTKADNLLSNNFYKKLGFKFFYEDKFFGDKFNYYISSSS